MVKLKTPRLPEADGARSGKSAPNNLPLKLLMLGDSAAAGVGVSHQDEALAGNLVDALAENFCVDWQLIAWSGCKTADMLAHLKNKPQKSIDVVVTSLGVNDVTSSISAEKWLALQVKLLASLRTRFSPKLIIFSAIPPMAEFPALPRPLNLLLGERAEKFNRLVKAYLSTQRDCQFLAIRFNPQDGIVAIDGFHPGPAGYQMWGQAAAKLITSQLLPLESEVS